MKNYPKYVKVNRNDMEIAIRSGINPMIIWIDPKNEGLPYFENFINGSRYGNHHHNSFSAAHVTGRRLEALSIAQKVLNIDIEERVYENLEKWAYRVFENPMKMMCNWDWKQSKPEMICDLHNLREAMYSFLGILRRKPNDKKAYDMMHHIINMVERYTNYEKGTWKIDEFQKDTGGLVICSVCAKEEGIRFIGGLGRYIESLMRICQERVEPKALEQAIKLQKTFFRVVFRSGGEFCLDTFCSHIHSVTSTICGIAMLGDHIHDYAILKQVDKFMKKGFYDISIDLGWCTENYKRNDWIGEINNSCDLMETCLYLGKNGFEGYFGRAEEMLRNHILPSQLLDTGFIPDEENNDDSISFMGSRMKGAFGFPCPYGHEDHPGSIISFNWDITAGGVSGLCQAWKHRVYKNENMISINLLFDYEDENISFHDPYKNNGVAEIYLKKKSVVKIRMPKNSKSDFLFDKYSLNYRKEGEWLYIENVPVAQWIFLQMSLKRTKNEVVFKNKTLEMTYWGEQLESISSEGKRLCFFDEIHL